jgi:alpha-D-xyloside xylohydrolase
MKIRNTLILSSILAFMTFYCSLGQATIQRIPNGAQLQTDKLYVKVQFYAEDIVRVVKWLPNRTPEKKSLIVIQESLPDLNLGFREISEAILLASEKIALQISKNNGEIQYLTHNNKIILKEQGKAIITPVEMEHEKAFNIQQNFKLTPDEGIYGLGQHQHGYMNYRGRTIKLVQSNTDAVTPLLISTQGYGILWDNYSKTIFSDDKEKASFWSDVGDSIDYYFIYGKTVWIF